MAGFINIKPALENAKIRHGFVISKPVSKNEKGFEFLKPVSKKLVFRVLFLSIFMK